jgi:hypothetical protein
MTADLNGPNPPRYVWISPDLCNDMHGGVTAKIKGFPETPCPYSNVAGDQNDELPLTLEEGFGLSELGYTSDASQVHPLWRLILSHH